MDKTEPEIPFRMIPHGGFYWVGTPAFFFFFFF